MVLANRIFWDYHQLDPEGLIGQPLDAVVPGSLLLQPKGREALHKVFQTGETVLLKRMAGRKEAYHNRVVNLLLSRVRREDGAPLAIVVIEDITESLEKAYQSSLLRQVGQTMEGILDLDRLLYAILTGATAGTALGFNRAILLLVDPEKGVLEGKMAVGPSSVEEAGQI